MIVQDVEREYRFDEGDLNFLSSLASQVAIAIRNTSLVSELQRQVEQERISIQILYIIWSSTNADMILTNALNELGHSLKASDGMISLEVSRE